MFVDCHSHILPNIDDGAQSVDMSIQMVNALLSQDVSQIWLTPHFSPSEQSIEGFIKNRNRAFEAIKNNYNDGLFILGSEVELCKSLLSCEDVSALCINNTQYMLVEFNGDYTFDGALQILNNLISKYAITPIIAHIERYTKVFPDNKAIQKLIRMGCILQMNTKIFNSFSLRRSLAIERISRGEITLLGTDCHNMSTRAPHFITELNYIEKKLGHDIIKEFESNAFSISMEKQAARIFI